MFIKPIIWKTPKDDGMHSIRIYVSHLSSKAYITTPFSCKLKDFENGKVKSSLKDYIEINQKLMSMCAEITTLVYQNISLHGSEIVELYKSKTTRPNFNKIIPFVDHFINECKAGNIKRAKETIKKYKTCRNLLREYDEKIRFEDISKQFYIAFTGNLRTAKGYKENSIGSVIKTLKVFLNEANEMGVSNIQEHKKKYFSSSEKDETDAIYLNNEELDSIINIDLTNYPHLQVERDRFIVSTFLLLRYSDSIRIKKDMFFEHMVNGAPVLLFRQRAQKVNKEVIVPVKPIVKEIMERYNYNINTDTNYESNWKIKEIGKLAGINLTMTINGVTGPKHTFISTHTARRSGATNMYLAGIDTKIIMALGGWKKIETFLKYIRVTQLETALSIATHPQLST